MSAAPVSAWRRAVRAYPTLLRVGVAEVVAYRAEFIVWVLTTNMPLVMMSLWTAVAAAGPVGRFGQRDFVTYYLATLIVRLVTNSWLVWEMTMEIRQGTLATRLLRPMHPLLAYSAAHLAAVPLRVVVVSPIVVVLAFVGQGRLAFHDPALVLIFLASVAGAWLILFATMIMIGSLALFFDSALLVFELWLGVQFVFSGYLIPLELLPGWLAKTARVLPFRYTISFPVETLIGLNDRATALRGLGVQGAYAAGFMICALALWQRGMRRFVSFGG